MNHKELSAALVLALAFIAAIVSIWQTALGDFSRAGCWCMIVIYWVVLTLKNLADWRGIRK